MRYQVVDKHTANSLLQNADGNAINAIVKGKKGKGKGKSKDKGKGHPRERDKGRRKGIVINVAKQ
eukprot:2413589-Amphidinium_carterae.1